jgi:transposase
MFWKGVGAFMRARGTNGAIEAINGLLQLLKRVARRSRSLRHYCIMAYLKAGKLQRDLPPLRSLPNHSNQRIGPKMQ